MIEFTNDEEDLVRMEGIKLLTEYFSLFKKNVIDEEFLPQIEKQLKISMDPKSLNEIRVDFA